MNRFLRRLFLPCLGVCLFVVAGCLPTSTPDNNTMDELLIRLADGKEIPYMVEIADTDETRRLGLMYREFMPVNHGMLLDFDSSRDASIWMKNTYIPLDLIYIDKNGKIVYLHKDAIPHDTTSISSGGKVKSVLELNANQIEKQGLKVGDLVIHPIYGTSR
jgi:uncharacterized membrane protein (UPF0127 family)